MEQVCSAAALLMPAHHAQVMAHAKNQWPHKKLHHDAFVPVQPVLYKQETRATGREKVVLASMRASEDGRSSADAVRERLQGATAAAAAAGAGTEKAVGQTSKREAVIELSSDSDIDVDDDDDDGDVEGGGGSSGRGGVQASTLLPRRAPRQAFGEEPTLRALPPGGGGGRGNSSPTGAPLGAWSSKVSGVVGSAHRACCMDIQPAHAVGPLHVILIDHAGESASGPQARHALVSMERQVPADAPTWLAEVVRHMEQALGSVTQENEELREQVKQQASAGHQAAGSGGRPGDGNSGGGSGGGAAAVALAGAGDLVARVAALEAGSKTSAGKLAALEGSVAGCGATAERALALAQDG